MATETVELIDGVSGNFLTPVTEKFTKEAFNLDELIGASNYRQSNIDGLQAALAQVQSEKDEIDAKIAKARAGGAKTSAELAIAEVPVEVVVPEAV